MDNMCKLKFCSLFLVIFSLFFSGFTSAEEDIRIALRAHQNSQLAIKQWQPTADYLSKNIPGYRFVMVPFTNISAMNQAVSSGDFQFSLTNPSSAIEYIIHYDAQPLATLVNKRQGKGYSEFGSVIFTRSNRKDINKLKDLKGKVFIAVDEQAFGGWRVAWLELLKNEINPFTDFKVLRFASGIQQDVVYAVLNGKADAGTVRTDMLERMAAKGEINLGDLKIIGKKTVPNFPFMLCTDLYPEWLFSTAGIVDEKLKTKVTQALLSISVDDLSAIKGKYVKWIMPLDYTPVEDLLKELKVGPYNIATMDAYKRLISQYGTIVVLIILFVLFLILVILRILKLNKEVLQSKELLKRETELSKKLEIQLLHSQRIESLGTLTGGIAHEFNNLLASILGYTELALDTENVKKDKKLTAYLTQVVDASGKSAELVNQMLTFSRSEGASDKKENLSVAALFSDVEKLLQPIIPGNFTVNINKPDKYLFINASSAMMTQVLMNLYLNAKDAIENKNGVITIDSKVVSFSASDKICSSCHQDIQGEYIEISVEDNGCGTDPETIEHLFEPFFTTKEVGKGTGMGLSIAHGITHEHSGHILIDSEVDVGTTVKILLPKVEQ